MVERDAPIIRLDDGPAVHIKVELTQREAEALAQFCKRVTFTTLEQHAQFEDEKYAMRAALHMVELALADQGYRPR